MPLPSTFEECLDLIKQLENRARYLDPVKYQEWESRRMKTFLEPHFEGTVRQSGDLFVTRKRYGTHCYVYFAGKKDKSEESQ